MRIKFYGFIAVSIFTLMLSVQCAKAQNQPKTSKDEQEIATLVKQMTDAQTGFDTKTLERIYASDYVEVSPIGDVDMRGKVVSFYKPEANPERYKMKTNAAVDEFLIRAYGNFAVVIARFTFTFTATEAGAALPPAVSLRATVVCRKEKGVWKVGSVQSTAIRPSHAPKK